MEKVTSNMWIPKAKLAWGVMGTVELQPLWVVSLPPMWQTPWFSREGQWQHRRASRRGDLPAWELGDEQRRTKAGLVALGCRSRTNVNGEVFNLQGRMAPACHHRLHVENIRSRCELRLSCSKQLDKQPLWSSLLVNSSTCIEKKQGGDVAR
jgi:hypothetical protein